MTTDPELPAQPLELAPETAFPGGEEKKGLWRKLKRGLFMTHTELIERMDAAVKGRTVLDDEALEYLEESLIAADLGVATSLELIEKLRPQLRAADAGDLGRLRQILADEVTSMLADAPAPASLTTGPAVILMIGGVGKTTTTAKLTRWLCVGAEGRLTKTSELTRRRSYRQKASYPGARPLPPRPRSPARSPGTPPRTPALTSSNRTFGGAA